MHRWRAAGLLDVTPCRTEAEMPGKSGPPGPLRGCVVSVGVCASLAGVPAACPRGLGCVGWVPVRWGCGRLCRPQWVCPFCLVSPFCQRGPLGHLCEGGSGPRVCAFPGRPRTLVLRATPLLGEGSSGCSAQARARGSPPALWGPGGFFPATARAPAAGWVTPLGVTAPLRGVCDPACSIPRPGVRPRVSPCAACAWVLWSAWPVCGVRCAVCGSVRARLVLRVCVSRVCATCFPVGAGPSRPPSPPLSDASAEPPPPPELTGRGDGCVPPAAACC